MRLSAHDARRHQSLSSHLWSLRSGGDTGRQHSTIPADLCLSVLIWYTCRADRVPGILPYPCVRRPAVEDAQGIGAATCVRGLRGATHCSSVVCAPQHNWCWRPRAARSTAVHEDASTAHVCMAHATCGLKACRCGGTAASPRVGTQQWGTLLRPRACAAANIDMLLRREACVLWRI